MYSTVADVRNALAPGGQSVGTATTLTDPQIEDAINQADSVINTYVGHLYIIPLVDVEIIVVDPPSTTLINIGPVPIRYWSRDLAAYLATLTFKRNQNVPEDDPVRLRMNMVMQQLVMVRDGKVVLPFPSPGETSGDQAAYVFNMYSGDLWGPDDFGLAPANTPRAWGTWPGGPL